MNFLRTLVLAAVVLFATAPSQAQWQVPNHSVPIGQGGGAIGFSNAAPGTAGLPLVSNGASSDPSFAQVPNIGLAPGANGTFKCTSGGAVSDCLVGSPTTHVLASQNYTLQSTDCWKTTAITGGFFTFTLPASASGFSEGCVLIVMNGDTWTSGTPRGKSLANFPAGTTNGQNILWPGRFVAVQVVGGGFSVFTPQGRTKLPSGVTTINTDFVNGTDTAGATDGFATGASAFKSVQQAMYTGCSEFELNSLPQSLLHYVMAANTTDTTGVHYACPSIPGGQGGAYVYVTGGTNATINTANIDAFDVVTGSTVSISGITLSASGTVPSTSRPADCMRADYGGRIFMLANTFSVCAGSNIAAENGGTVLIQAGNYTVEGNMTHHLFATTGGSISTDYINVTQSASLAASVTVSGSWAFAGPGGVINVPSWTALTGAFTVTGTKAATTGNGAIGTGAGTAACNNTYFPGTANGSVASPFCS